VEKAGPYGEEYFRPLIERALDVVLVLNRDGTIRYESPSIQNVTGYTPEERKGKSVFDLIHPDDMASATSAFSQLLQNQVASAHMELRLQHKDGSWRSIEAIGQNLLDHPVVAGIVANFRDITERKQAEEALRESEQKYKTILEAIEDGYYEVDLAGNFTFFNDPMCGIIGYSKDEMMGMNNRQYMDKENAKKVYQAFNRVYTTGKHTKEFGWEIIRKDGTKRFVEASVSLKRNSEGEPIGFRGIVRDIAERKRTEEALRQSEEKFRRLVEDMNDGYCVLQGARVVFANARSAEMFGYTVDEVIGKTVQELLPPELVSELSRVSARRQRGETVPSQYETRLVAKDGRTRPVEFGTRVIDYAGKPALSVVIRDITERKQAEEALRESEHNYKTLFESMIDGMVVIDAETMRIVLANGTAAKMYGFDSAEEVVEANLLDYLHPDDRDRALTSIAEDMFEKDLRQVNEFRTITKDGREIWVSGVSTRIEYGGRLAGLVSFRDITDRKQAEEEIRRLNEQLEQRVIERTTQLEAVNKELEAFAYSVSHDLRAPLRSIDGFSQVLLEDYAGNLDEEGKDYLQRVRSGSQRMAELIDDILNLSRLTRGEMRHETVDLSALAQTIATELQQSQPGRQVEFIITPGLVATGDAHLLQVALENLLENAWKFTRSRAPARIEFGYAETNGQPAYFVRDNGVGFDMAYADKLFGAFQRLHSTSEFEGTGIGLATVQRIIHRHGGNIWAESAVDQGATFYFTL